MAASYWVGNFIVLNYMPKPKTKPWWEGIVEDIKSARAKPPENAVTVEMLSQISGRSISTVRRQLKIKLDLGEIDRMMTLKGNALTWYYFPKVNRK